MRPLQKIMVVADEPHIARLVKANLVHAGYSVITALSGDEAVERAKEEKPDLILLDDVAASIVGPKALRMLRADPDTKEIQVIARAELKELLRGARLPPGEEGSSSHG